MLLVSMLFQVLCQGCSCLELFDVRASHTTRPISFIFLSHTTTEHLIGSGKQQQLEEEYQCTILLIGKGSNNGNNNSNLPHLLITMKGYDTRQLGRVRRALEDSLIDYIVQNTPEEQYRDKTNRRRPPPALGRLLYSLALSAANASPKMKDRSRHRTVLGRDVYSIQQQIATAGGGGDHEEYEHYAPPAKKVWMNVVELPYDEETGEYHGRFLSGRNGSLFQYYRTKFNCQVNVYGVWGDRERGGGEEEEGEAVSSSSSSNTTMICNPYVLVTSKEGKRNVDNCLQFIEHRIREHQEQFGVSRDRVSEKVASMRRENRTNGGSGGGRRPRRVGGESPAE